MQKKAKNRIRWQIGIMSLGIFLLTGVVAHAGQLPLDIPAVDINITEPTTPTEYVTSIKLLILLTVLTMAPSFILLATSFTRILIAFSFMRSAMGTQQVPPNQVLVALALFLTLFIMSPVYTEVIDNAVNPYMEGTITQEQAIEIGSKPIKNFMLNQTREKDLSLFFDMSETDPPTDRLDTPFIVLIPAFTISELKTAFEIGFLIFMPFIVIDMVVSSILMAMGMMMLPPVMVALPFKLLLFVMVDGWYLIVESLMRGFIR